MRSSAGFTLAELLIVVSIVGLLLTPALANLRRQIDRGFDARRKADINLIRRAFEGYYDDHQCYPPLTVLNQCGGSQLAPYLSKIPCDPTRASAYSYKPMDVTNLCRGYVLMTILADTVDPDIVAVGCTGAGCGWGGGYNWGVSSGGPVAK